MDDEVEESGDDGGGAGWIMTFADLMSLLMCFFVLLLSFSEMDVLKFKRLAGSMKSAFGVQQQLNVNQVPKGTSVIAQEFSPGTPLPTPLNEIWQKTTDISRNSLDTACQDLGSSNSGELGDAQRLMVLDKIADLVGETAADAARMVSALESEVLSGQVEVETEGRKIVVRLKERGIFESGSDKIASRFMPAVAKVSEVLLETPGSIAVEGHTDSVPISTSRFRSNWALSSARAVSIAHELMADGRLTRSRFQVSGRADTKPLEQNTTPQGRARNRRVELVIRQGLGKQLEDELRELQATSPEQFNRVQQEAFERFQLNPEEIF